LRYLLLFSWPIICAIANRIRGGWLSYEIIKLIPFWGDTMARIFVSSIIALPVFLHCHFFESLVFLGLLFIGFVWGWSPWMSMNDPVKDTLELTKRGFFLTFPAGCFLKLWLFAFAGLLMGIAYLCGLYFMIRHKESDGHVWGATESGELYFGALLGLFIIISII
jgi:hypothetical protein